jgi:hypothetical protein
MYRDTTSIANLRTCTFIVDDDTIHSIGTGIVSRPSDIYQLIGNKYEKINTTETSSSVIPENTICLTTTTITKLQTNYSPINTTTTTVDMTSVNNTLKDIVLPFYHVMAIVSALFIFYAAYKLILYPWHRRRT